jgi:hypothetical protein
MRIVLEIIILEITVVSSFLFLFVYPLFSPSQSGEVCIELVSTPLVPVVLQPYSLFHDGCARVLAEHEEPLASVNDDDVVPECAGRIEE